MGDLTKNRAENDQLTKQLKTEITQKVCPGFNQHSLRLFIETCKHLSLLLGTHAEGADWLEESIIVNKMHSAVRSQEKAGTTSNKRPLMTWVVVTCTQPTIHLDVSSHLTINRDVQRPQKTALQQDTRLTSPRPRKLPPTPKLHLRRKLWVYSSKSF